MTDAIRNRTAKGTSSRRRSENEGDPHRSFLHRVPKCDQEDDSGKEASLFQSSACRPSREMKGHLTSKTPMKNLKMTTCG